MLRFNWRRVLSRPPTAQELALTREFLASQVALFHAASPQERAPARGLAPPSLDPVQRARESLIHALFNHNDFVTVR